MVKEEGEEVIGGGAVREVVVREVDTEEIGRGETDIGEKYRLARERKIKKKKEGDDESSKILNEIAKLKGFKGRKKVEKTGDKIKIIDISPLAEWAEYHAKELGFEGKKKGEKINGTVIERTITPIEEFVDYMVRRTGRGKSDIMTESYIMLIPQEEIVEGLERLKKIWLENHEKFINFCGELAQSIKKYYEDHKTDVAAITMDNMFKTMDEYHRKYPGSLNIYTRDELVIGLGYCLPEKGISPKMAATKTAITFEKILTGI